ncbi:MAG: hypothetical protein SH850_18580, partial [Planctomycetaceae bacterium]|nr:hypothetical protein [Planctomycetaceae bacterium]
MRSLNITCGLLLAFVTQIALAAERTPAEIVAKVVATAGGEDKLLKLFRVEERLAISSDPAKPGNPRTSVIEPPTHWWLGKKERVK